MQILNPDEADELSKQFTAGKIYCKEKESKNLYIFHIENEDSDYLELLRIDADYSLIKDLLFSFSDWCRDVTENGEDYDDYHSIKGFIDHMVNEGIDCKRIMWHNYFEF